MKAPDKIYLNTSDGDYEFAEWNVVPYAEVTTEYIRKDALLEWAKERKRLMEDEIGFRLSIDDVIEKLNNF